jgi:hypothetical protein
MAEDLMEELEKEARSELSGNNHENTISDTVKQANEIASLLEKLAERGLDSLDESLIDVMHEDGSDKERLAARQKIMDQLSAAGLLNEGG